MRTRMFLRVGACVVALAVGGCGEQVVSSREPTLVEGDIAVPAAPHVVADGAADGARGALRWSDSWVRYFAWSGGVVPYKVAAGFPSPARVTEAIEHYHRTTKVRFVPRTTQTDYVVFTAGSGCWSYIGRNRGAQTISLGSGCGTPAAIHELGHALGLWHEHTRPDRDKVITIQWANIVRGAESNFQVNGSSKSYGAYDLASIMHYAWWSFSANGRPTITLKNGSTAGFGQRSALSAGDVAAIHAANGL